MLVPVDGLSFLGAGTRSLAKLAERNLTLHQIGPVLRGGSRRAYRVPDTS
jgi:hypothetical protein